MIKTCTDTKESYGTYEEYLKTKHWLKVKARYVLKYVKMCSMCESTTWIDLHHITYNRIGNERDEDLIWLCRTCHKKIHAIHAKDERTAAGLFLLKIRKVVVLKRKPIKNNLKKRKNTH